MRKTLLTALLSIAALGAVPAAASAEIVTLVNGSGEPLEAGSDVYGTSTNMRFVQGNGTIRCELVQFTGEVSGNGTEAVSLEGFDIDTKECYVEQNGYIYDFTAITVSGPLGFLPAQAMSVPSTQWNYGIYSPLSPPPGGTPLLKCSQKSTYQVAQWEDLPEAAAVGLVLKIQGSGCWDHIGSGGFVLSEDIPAEFESPEEPIHIIEE